MTFRILGPLAVIPPAGDALPPKGRKQRLLLSTLLLHAPRVVSTERLIEILWEDEEPDDPTASLRTQLSRLRSFLRSVDADALQSEPHGYRLVVPASRVDAARFEALLAEARAAGSPARELELLEEALALWRGRPFEEFADLPAFVGQVSRLEELRAGACERRVERLLALRRTGDAIVAVEPLLHRDPLRERPRALYMEALHRAGRQHEALSAFQEFRRLVSEELGLDPSPALVRLQEEILRNGAATDGSLAPDLSHGTPPVPEPDAPLPLPLSRLVGRGEEQASLLRLLGECRLLTLTGVGGSGKTRLALEVAHRVRGEGREVVWVALDPIADPAFVAREIAAVLGIREHPGRAPTRALCDVLARRDLLLVLDNCEHVIAAAADIAHALLERCPGVTILATSREPLGIPGETAWPVPPLRVPPDDASELGGIADVEAVQLFADRAKSAMPGFELDDENASAVADVCRRLDGLPLCLELAAALVRVLTPAEIALRLHADLDVLASGSRTARPRHQTMRQAIDWSYELLSDPERRLLERLAVFSGGFTLAAAEAVCADGHELDRGRILPLLAALVDKSLVVVQQRGGVARYRLLQTVRTYAGERLHARGERRTLQARHAAFFVSFAEEAEPHLRRAQRGTTVRRVQAEQENLRGALAWAIADPAGHLAAYRLTGALFWYWQAAGRFEEARRWAEAALGLACSEADDRLRIRTRCTAAMGRWLLGDPAAALAHAEEAIGLGRALDEPALLVLALGSAAWALRDLGEAGRAIATADECVEVARRGGVPRTDLGFALSIQMSTAFSCRDVDKARAVAVEVQAVWEATGDRWGLSMVYHGLALCELEGGRIDEAERLCRRSVEVLRDDGEPHFVARSVEGLATVLARKGDTEEAARLLAAAETIRERIGAPLLPFEEARHRATLAAVAERLGPAVHDALRGEGRALRLHEVIALAAGAGA